MLIGFFESLRRFRVPVSLRELLDLCNALQAHVAFGSVDEFYMLSRAVMVKDEKFYDRFDQAFASYFEGLESLEPDWLSKVIPDEWLRKELEKNLSQEDFEKLQGLGSLEKILDELRKRLEEQQKRHQGGNKWVGTGGTSPFGGHGANPEGVRMTGPSRNKKAVKVWEKREFRNLDDSVELGTRNIKLALRRLRKFARTSNQEELDLDDTIRSTAANAGLLDIKMRREQENRAKVLLFFDVGGSMDPFIKICEELFSAARVEFKHMEYFYFHNFVYEYVWKDNRRRWDEKLSTWDVLHKYGSDYKVIFVGDAAMSPYEVNSVGGSVEHWNDEAGAVWFQRIMETFEKVVWLNPEPQRAWQMTTSTQWIKQLVEHNMFPLTLEGLEKAMRYLSK
ncbi:vWA domain-containing protein [Alcanivorax sediminis]|uniref:VWA domain-containing protein n=1 Tax=Alcanivorax sediminis TaxID=2663008 RepID=A0A6N7LXV5_9GAMM|nr:VWA domain-containing protein [Alcanivorax sediminis]MQX54004.1 VWA domain-containing protein [Alcanivorax sediminis]